MRRSRIGGAAKGRGKIFGLLLILAVLQLAGLPALGQVAQNFDDVAAQAAAARDVRDIPHAIDLYTEAVRINPKWQDGWWFLGSLQYGSGAYAPAIEALTHFLELKPNAAPALALRGLCEFESGSYDLSLMDIQKAIAFGAANDTRNEQILRYHEAILLTRLGRFQDALKSFSYFAEHKIANPELFVSIGLAGLRMPILPKDVSPDQQPLVAAAGNAAYQFMSGDEKSAEAAFQNVFAQFPTAANIHYLYGHLLFTTDPDSALVQFQRELEVAPSNTTAEVMTAWAFLMRNRPAEALPYAKTAAGQQPQQAAAQLVLGRSLMDTEDLTGGIQHLEQALKLEPDNLEVHIALAKAYSKSGRKDDARRERMLCLQLTEANATQLAHP
ncbi:MAG TPA: tetratricopeptide repeat protein [Terriglobales bacterium]|jgi:tetratricopeptide (TPR) repeat protein